MRINNMLKQEKLEKLNKAMNNLRADVEASKICVAKNTIEEYNKFDKEEITGCPLLQGILKKSLKIAGDLQLT
jgi:hypothetical protein